MFGGRSGLRDTKQNNLYVIFHLYIKEKSHRAKTKAFSIVIDRIIMKAISHNISHPKASENGYSHHPIMGQSQNLCLAR